MYTYMYIFIHPIISVIFFFARPETAAPRQLWKTWGTKLTSLALDLGMLLGQAEVVTSVPGSWDDFSD